jgi:hypothetical protein
MHAANLPQWRVAHSAVAAACAFMLAALFVPHRTLMQFLNMATLSVAVAIVITYSPAWAATLLKKRLNGEDALSLGIGCTWLAEIGQRLWSIIWRGLDQPGWMTDSYVLPLLLTLNFLGGVQHITAPGAVDGVVPRRNWIILGAAVGVATFLFLALLWFGNVEVFGRPPPIPHD